MSSQGVPYYVTYAHMKRQIVPALRFNQSLYEEALEQTLRPGDRWLDAGCGWKVLPEWRIDSELSLVHRAGMVVGCDLDASAIAKHRSFRRRTVCNLSRLPFKSYSLDLITCNMVMEHVDNPLATLAEFFRVLRPGGRVIVHTPSKWSYFGILTRVVPDRLKRRIRPDGRAREDYYPVRYRCNTLAKMRQLGYQVGFRSVLISRCASDASMQFLAGFRLGRLILRLELYILKLSLAPRFAWLRPTLYAVFTK